MTIWENNVIECFAPSRPLLQLFWHGGDIVAAPVQPHSFAGGLHAVCKELKGGAQRYCIGVHCHLSCEQEGHSQSRLEKAIDCTLLFCYEVPVRGIWEQKP